MDKNPLTHNPFDALKGLLFAFDNNQIADTDDGSKPDQGDNNVHSS